MKLDEITVTFQFNKPRIPIIIITEKKQLLMGTIIQINFLKTNQRVPIMNKKTPNTMHLREKLLCSTLDIPEEPIKQFRNDCLSWLIVSATVNIVLLVVLIMNFKTPNKNITPEQEQKLDVAIERMTEVTDFIKLNSNE